jgi:2'-hydroxyisoflavone reductase
VRVAKGGEVLAPGGPERSVQLIDARDLADWILRMAEQRRTGIYDAAGPRQTMGTLLETCREVSASDARFTWVSDSFLVAERVGAWTELPFWMPEERMPQRLIAVDSQKAVRDGLRYRPLRETIADTLVEARGRNLRAGLTADREQQLLRKWSADRSTAPLTRR